MNWTDGKSESGLWRPGTDFPLGFGKFRLLGRMG